ncbi:WD40 repeat-like protein [Hymenopellis radicata]|nr:WD40 repeat-like protein [Hymenopellis radicata]
MPFQYWPKRFPHLGRRKKQRNNSSSAVSGNDRGLPPEASQASDTPSVVTSTAISRNDSAKSELVPATVSRADPTSVTTSDTASSAAIRNASADSKTPAKTTASATVLHGFQEALKIVKEASDVFVPLKSVVGGLLACVDAYQRTAANHEEMEKVIRNINGLLATLVAKRLEWRSASKNSDARMVKLEGDLNQIIEEINGLQSRGFLARLAENAADARELVSAYQKIEKVLRAFQFEISLEIEQNVQDILKEVVIRDLRRSRDASFRAAIKTDTLSRGPCTSGTRVEILDKIMSWARDNTTDSPPVFWLTGLAGTGKTTIAYTICERMWAENKLLVSFFCSRQLDSKDSQLIVPTICRNLAELFRSYATELVPVLQADSVLGEARIHEQIDGLLVAPWSTSLPKRDGLPVPVVVIDALDESDDGVEFLKNLFRVVGDKHLMGIKFLVTSRAEPKIEKLCHSFQLPADMIYRLHEVPKIGVQADIAKFLAEQLPEVDTNERTQLTLRADGLFIFAATAVRFISPPDYPLSQYEQREKLQELLEPGSPSGLDELYKQVLSVAFREEDAKYLRRRLDILHAVVCAQELISISVIAQLLSLDEGTTMTCINSLHSVLYVSPLDRLVSCYHASFPEFILDAQRSQFIAPPPFTKMKSQELEVFCDKPVFDSRLADCCFRIMESELWFNICKLSSSSKLDREVDNLHDLVEANISSVVRYAAHHWGQHLLAAGRINRSSLHGKLQAFLTNVFLFWLEAMNLLGSKSLCFPLLQVARRWLKLEDEPKAESYLSDLVDDAANFVTSFIGSSACQSTPHLYISCLSTWSSSAPISKIWKPRFKHLPLFLPAPVGTASLLTIPTSAVVVAFSPDDLKLASSGWFSVAKIWDSTTGELLQELVGPVNRITSMSFSDDDGSIHIWDVSTGEHLKVLFGHIDCVMAVAFSHDTRYIVSGSWDTSVCIWALEPKVGDQSKRLRGHTDWVTSVAFSPDDTQVVSCSADQSVRIWDVKMRQQVRVLIGHTYVVSCVMFSPCGSQILSASQDMSLRIWDASTGEELKQFDFTSDVTPFAFSRDGQKIASRSLDNSIQVWDITKEELLNDLIGHTGQVWSVMFSHDGTRIVSGSDNSIHVWTMTASKRLDSTPCQSAWNWLVQECRPHWELQSVWEGDPFIESIKKLASNGCFHDSKRPKMLKGHTHQVQCVVFSSDGEQIISSSPDKTIQIWDTTTGQQLKELDHHLGSDRDCQSLASLSSDGTLACSATEKSILSIWDTASGILLKEQCIDGIVTWLSFSPDSTHIVTGLESGSLIIWDSRTGEQLGTLEGHQSAITCVAFFPDSFQLVSGSKDRSIRTWDMRNGGNMKVLTGHATSVAVSVGGEKIVSGSPDGSVIVWDAKTGARLKDINLDDRQVNSVAFSPRVEHPQIVVGLNDNSVRVWDETTGAVRVLRGHTGRVWSVAFSPDGTRIVSGSDDTSARVWRNIDDPSWHVDSEGWIWSHDDSLRLMWLSPEWHPSLLTPETAMILWQKGYCTLSFEDCNHLGEEWHKCYK